MADKSAQSLRIIVTGLIAQHPWLGGVAWDYLQYPLGLRALGHDVYYFEDSGEWPYTLDGGPSGNDWVAPDASANLRHLRDVMDRIGMAHRWAYRFPRDAQWFGLSAARRREILGTADLVLNISGTLEHPEEYRGATRLAYIDSDPVFTQIKIVDTAGFAEFGRRVRSHDVHFSFGEKLSAAHVPDTAYSWLPTRQPIVCSQWRTAAHIRRSFTTVMSWTSYKPLTHHGETFGQKDKEFQRFLDLPQRIRPGQLEVAVGGLQHANWESGDDAPQVSAADLLRSRGWSVVDAFDACGGVDSYRDYVVGSRGEWSVAKNGYVKGRAGWFSCRSACYLAAGRPVVVEDTGFEGVIPTGLGVVAFTSLEEATDAIAEVDAHYPRHANAARELATEYFDSGRVLTSLVERAMAQAPNQTDARRFA